MSQPPPLRRADRVMPDAETLVLLERGFSGRLATIGADGYPYCLPMLYVWMDGAVWLHNTGARGHLRANVEHDARACFEVDEPEQVFAYGRFECDTGLAYASVILFGAIGVVEDTAVKQRFFTALMAKYMPADTGRPAGFFPRLDAITLYCVTPERITGKKTPLPDVSQRWPAADRTKSPQVERKPD